MTRTYLADYRGRLIMPRALREALGTPFVIYPLPGARLRAVPDSAEARAIPLAHVCRPTEPAGRFGPGAVLAGHARLTPGREAMVAQTPEGVLIARREVLESELLPAGPEREIARLRARVAELERALARARGERA